MKLNQLTQIFDQLAPLKHAEAWDNTGLLLAPLQPREIQRVLLTIDLTESVADEAIAQNSDLILSYHPILFNPIQRLNPSKPADRTLMKLIQNNIAVYSPHTALDTAPDGTNDWLARTVGDGEIAILHPHADEPTFGQGRLVTLKEPVTATEICARLKANLHLENLRIAGDPQKEIRTIALCAGAGSSVISGTCADLYLTGEMSHHHTLAAIQEERVVILCEHTNTERGYLPVLKARIQELAELDIQLAQTDRDPLTVH
jgi:dinuclear metal center YbgI/SA1388 family protein